MSGLPVWFEARGAGPVIIFPCRTRKEHADLAERLADRFRVVRYMPRHVTGIDAPEGDAEDWVTWEEQEDGPAFWGGKPIEDFPVELEVADLHRVADEAGAGRFVLAGYSGTAALAAFLAPLTPRAAGLLAGGFPILGSKEYWMGSSEGARLAYLTAGLRALADNAFATALMYRAWHERDDRPALTAIGGPKILWFGANDGEPGCLLHESRPGIRLARRLRETRAELETCGFTVLELPGLDHMSVQTSPDTVAARLRVLLAEQNW
ncbi:pimeloyl-ACP methyl ester carboxylesterase [Catenuloplanes nepalensis]|uniref:Pimeloyl-ACP methyl ester carboxylesterase n=1 Tax=Catenuloplanes nepalensis TaxID=587533 RepID=A0ABT9MWF0_9ACTN|nr:hypothetical protein [Catenuloplanes nepalensis]MDP9795767.1 pimeloyl-ACP methyl ester carboxylesterase [Catenuloplanes nepalensis]